MILEQYYLGCLAQASYLIACERSRVAVVVDPRRDVDEYLAEAETRGLTIERVFLTHFHADFLAGHLELRARTGATIHLGARAQADYAFEPLADGATVAVGETVRLEIRETPGHTPEGISIVVYDLEEGPDTPHAVLTGDTLFIGDVGRPDLMASVGVTAEELATMLYDSLHEKLLTLPDSTKLYPGHGAGSMCGKNLSSETVSTIGAQRRTNYALQLGSKQAFVEAVAAGQPAAPAYFAYDARLNRQEHETLDTALERGLKALGLEDVLRLQNAGAQVLDVRGADAFAARHLVGSVNVGLGGKYATWAGSVLDPQRPIVLVTEAGQEREAAMRLGRIGFDDVAGYLDGGPAAFAPEQVARFARLDVPTLDAVLQAEAPPFLLDVRTGGEREDGGIAGSSHVPLKELPGRMDEVPRDREVVVYCRGGYRSAIAVSLLGTRGIAATDLVGGITAWKAAHAAADA